MSKVNVFVSYSHENVAWVDPNSIGLILWLQAQLAREDVSVWFDRELRKTIGSDYELTITHEIDRAHLVILLLSQDFFSSDFITKIELPRIKARYDTGQVVVFPINIDTFSDTFRPKNSWIFKLQIFPNERTCLIEYIDNAAEWSKRKVELFDTLLECIHKKVRTESTGTEERILTGTQGRLPRIRTRSGKPVKTEETENVKPPLSRIVVIAIMFFGSIGLAINIFWPRRPPETKPAIPAVPAVQGNILQAHAKPSTDAAGLVETPPQEPIPTIPIVLPIRPPDEYYDLQKEIDNDQRKKNAYTKLQNLITMNRDNPWYILIQEQLNENAAESIGKLEAGLAQSPGLVDYYHVLAMKYVAQDKPEEGVAWLKKGLAIDPRHVSNNNVLCFIRRKMVEKELDGENGNPETSSGSIRLTPAQRVMMQEALAAGRVAEENLSSARFSYIPGAVFFNIGRCYEMLNQPNEAAAYYYKTLERTPGHDEASKGLQRIGGQ